MKITKKRLQEIVDQRQINKKVSNLKNTGQKIDRVVSDVKDKLTDTVGDEEEASKIMTSFITGTEDDDINESGEDYEDNPTGKDIESGVEDYEEMEKLKKQYGIKENTLKNKILLNLKKI